MSIKLEFKIKNKSVSHQVLTCVVIQVCVFVSLMFLCEMTVFSLSSSISPPTTLPISLSLCPPLLLYLSIFCSLCQHCLITCVLSASDPKLAHPFLKFIPPSTLHSLFLHPPINVSLLSFPPCLHHSLRRCWFTTPPH